MMTLPNEATVEALRKEIKVLVEYNTKLTRDFAHHVGKPNMIFSEIAKHYKQINPERILATTRPQDQEHLKDLFNSIEYYVTNYPATNT